MDIHAENVMDHYRYPRNRGVIPHATVSHEELHPACSDIVRLDLFIEKNNINDIKFSGAGCVISQAAVSMLTVEIQGKTVSQAEAITETDVLKMLGIPVSERRMKCALLCLVTVKKALLKYQEQKK